MQNLFTPIEVVRKHTLCYSTEELLRFNEGILFQITQPRIPSLADQRRQVVAWLKTLPVCMRQQAATLHSPQFTALARKLYQESLDCQQPYKYSFFIEDGEFRVTRQRFYKQDRQLQRELLLDVRLMSMGQLFESMTLKETAFQDPEALFEMFDRVLRGVFFDTTNFAEEELKNGKVLFEAEAVDVESKTIGAWIAQLLLKQILLSFATRGRAIEDTCKHMKEQELEYSKLWRELDVKERVKIVQKGFAKPPQEMMNDYRLSVGVDWRELPKIYIVKTAEEVIRQYAECNYKDFYNRLIFSTFEESLNLYEIFKIELSLEIEAYLSAVKSEVKKQKKKKKKNIEHLPNTVLNRVSDVVNKSVPLKIAAEIVRDEKMVQETVKKQVQSQQQEEKSYERPTEVASQQQPIFSHEKEQKVESQNIIDTFTKRLKQKNRDKYRKIIFNRLTVILARWNLVCRAYGSFAVHLSLPDSDLDIQVDSSLLGYFYLDFLSQRKQVIAALDFLKKIFEAEPWVSDLTLFYNARIPLLTFKADAGMHFVNLSNVKSGLRLNCKSDSKGDGIIQVDLSIEPYANMNEIPHNGLESTQSIREWVENLPYFEMLALTLKSVIRKANFHKSYEGGINSYCLLLLIAAFLRVQQAKPTSSDALFQGLVSFIQRFYEVPLEIDITSPTIIKQGADSPTLISPWDRRNLTERCFRLGEIVTSLRTWKSLLQK